MTTSYPQPDPQARIRELEDQIRQMAHGAEAPYGASPANLYVALEKPVPPYTWWQKLLHKLSPYSLFKIRPYGVPLDPTAQGALYFAAGLMTAIFILEAVGWTLLFNEVLNAGVMHVSRWTVPAVGFGLLFGFGIIALEQAILTVDTTRGWSRLTGTLFVRIFLIFASAVITTQSYELLVFSSEISARVHQESVRKEMVLRFPEYNELDRAQVPAPGSTAPAPAAQPRQLLGAGASDPFATACPLPDSVHPNDLVQGSTEPKDIFDAREKQNRREWFQDKVAGCKSAITASDAALSNADADISARGNDIRKLNVQLGKFGCPPQPIRTEPEICGRTRNQILTASNKVTSLRASRANLVIRQSELKIAEGTYSNKLANEGSDPAASGNFAAGDPEGATATPELMVKRRIQLKRYMDDLIASRPGQTVILPDYRGRPPTNFNDSEYGITDKVRVLYSELMSSPYQWPDVSRDRIEAIQRQFPLGDPPPGFHWYRWVPWGAVLCAAMFLPFVSLGYKATLNENLNLYFIPEYQEQLGHVGATLSTQAARRFHERRAEDTRPQSDAQGAGAPASAPDAPDAQRANDSGFGSPERRRSDAPFGDESSPRWEREATDQDSGWTRTRHESPTDYGYSRRDADDDSNNSFYEQATYDSDFGAAEGPARDSFPGRDGHAGDDSAFDRDDKRDKGVLHSRVGGGAKNGSGNSGPDGHLDNRHSDNPEI